MPAPGSMHIPALLTPATGNPTSITRGVADESGLFERTLPHDRRRPAGCPAGRRVAMLFSCCPETRQLVSKLGR